MALSVFQWDHIPGLDFTVSETGEKDSPASSPEYRPTRPTLATPSTAAAAKPDPGLETITVSDDEAKGLGSKNQHNE